MRNRHNHTACSSTPISLIARGYERAFHFPQDNLDSREGVLENDTTEFRVEITKPQRVNGWLRRVAGGMASRLLSVKTETV